MRMIDFFPEKLTLCGDTIEDSDYAYSVMTCEYLVNGVDAGEAMCHAINHHDKMVDKLRELADWFGQQDCGYCVGVADDLEKLLIEVSQ